MYGTRKIILKLPPFWIRNEELQEREIQNQMKPKTKMFIVFIWCFEFSRSWFSSFNLQKGGNFKIIFPLPYPIIYSPGSRYIEEKTPTTRKNQSIYLRISILHLFVMKICSRIQIDGQETEVSSVIEHFNTWTNNNVIFHLDTDSSDFISCVRLVGDTLVGILFWQISTFCDGFCFWLF